MEQREEERPWGLVGWMVSVLGRRLAVGERLEQALTGVLVGRSALVVGESWLEEVVVDGRCGWLVGEFFGGGGVSSGCVSSG